MPFTTAATVRDALTSSFSDLDTFCLLPCERLHTAPDPPDSWSIPFHLEHVSLANHFLLLTIAKGCRKALRRSQYLPTPGGESDLQILADIAIPGAFDWPPPLHMLPTGEVAVDTIRVCLTLQCEHCLQLLDAIPSGEGRLVTFSMSVNALGRLDMYQWLYFLAQHSRYHITLIKRKLF